MNYFELIKILTRGDRLSISGQKFETKYLSDSHYTLTPSHWKEVEIGSVVFVKAGGQLIIGKAYSRRYDKGLKVINEQGKLSRWTKSVFCQFEKNN